MVFCWESSPELQVEKLTPKKNTFEKTWVQHPRPTKMQSPHTAQFANESHSLPMIFVSLPLVTTYDHQVEIHRESWVIGLLTSCRCLMCWEAFCSAWVVLCVYFVVAYMLYMQNAEFGKHHMQHSKTRLVRVSQV